MHRGPKRVRPGPQILPLRSARRCAAPQHCVSANRALRDILRSRKSSIRGGAAQEKKSSFLLRLYQFSFDCPEIGECQLASFNKVGHHRKGRAAEQIEEITNQPAVNGFFREHGFKDMRVADLFHPANRAFFLQPVNHRLDSRVSRTMLLWQAFLNLADRRGTELPEFFEQLKFEIGDAAYLHNYLCRPIYYRCSLSVKTFVGDFLPGRRTKPCCPLSGGELSARDLNQSMWWCMAKTLSSESS